MLAISREEGELAAKQSDGKYSGFSIIRKCGLNEMRVCGIKRQLSLLRRVSNFLLI